ncbi:serine hydrolase [Nocardia huaxiensis]|uniref:Serine hydrolase n=1 Tax=Nocardia huaxiensis TaxID=2755382 RepID=A0A7D6ZT54_9NOCA|nr:serine hydrolase [Nocardia huaxiensis]QLY34703.1 serine hydrolase [Nocardia huaxiensis]UFT00408.1 class A beta-lactamase-related serine hydrolase [Nocardia huaxiensis]
MRKFLIAAAAVLPILAGCAQEESAEERCAPVPAAGVTSAEEWLGRINHDPDNISLVVDDGRGNTAERRADDQQPLASAVKIVPLAAYARAVAAGTLDPRERISVSEWERWVFPGTDGGAHDSARTRLTGDTVTLDELVSAMIRESDNSVPDYLRARLGDRALVEAAAIGGWQDYIPSSKLGDVIRAVDPSVTDTWAAARRYVDDPDYRAAMQSKSMPSYDAQAAWADTTPTGSARQLASMHRSIASGSFGPGADIARAQLEWTTPPDGFVAMGFKGGSYPGVLTDTFYLRRADGTVATAVLLNRRMPGELWASALSSGFTEQDLLIRAMSEPDMLRRLTCAL